MNDEPSTNRPDLRPAIRRLREIEKKCVSMGTRNEEFPLMQQRLASIIKRLEAGEEPSGAPLSYRGIARELFPLAHLFESVGFMSVGKEGQSARTSMMSPGCIVAIFATTLSMGWGHFKPRQSSCSVAIVPLLSCSGFC